MAKATLKERAERYVSGFSHEGEDATGWIEVGYLAGWHARGRAERLTKAERAVVEAAKDFARTPSSHGLMQELLQAVSALERARRKA